MGFKRTAVWAGLGLLVLGGGLSACGRHGGHNPEKAYKYLTYKVDDLLDDVDATEAQRTTVNGIKDGLFAEGKTFLEGQRQAKAELRAQWDSPAPDAARVHSLVDARIDALRAVAHKAADSALELHRTLTPEQRAELSKRLPHRE